MLAGVNNSASSFINHCAAHRSIFLGREEDGGIGYVIAEPRSGMVDGARVGVLFGCLVLSLPCAG